MTLDELMRTVLEVIPTATFGDDNDGQVIIYTDLAYDPATGTLVPMGEGE